MEKSFIAAVALLSTCAVSAYEAASEALVVPVNYYRTADSTRQERVGRDGDVAPHAALAIALATVAGHALRVARTHPALALREE